MWLNNIYYRVFVIFVFFFLPLELWSANDRAMPSAPVELRINSEVRVNAEKIVLGDIATIYAKSLADFEKLNSLVLTQFPEKQKTVKLPAIYIESRIREVLEGRDFKLNAPLEITFLAERLGISDQQFSEELLKRGKLLGKIPESVEVEVYPGSGIEQLSALKMDAFQIEAASDLQRWVGDLTFKVTPAGSEKVYWVKAKLKWFAEAWVAKQNIPFSQNILPSQFEARKMELGSSDILKVSENPDLELLLKSARARRSIHEGMALAKNMIERKPDATTGSSLKVVFLSETGIRVSADGSLIGSGIIGEEAKAKLKSSRKIVSGRLVSDNVMEVEL